MKKCSGKKFIALISILLVLLPAVLFPVAVKTAKAAVPTFETNPKIVGSTVISAAQNIISAVKTGFISGTSYAQFAQMILEWAFKLAVEALKRQLLNMIVDQIVAWIQGGGTPKFITDWPGFFRDAIDKAGGDFLQQIGLGLFCSPYNLTLRAAFIPIPQFSDRSACTLSQIGVNLDNFLKNFNSGGWIAWDEMVLKPQNNIYGAYLMAWNESEIRKSAADKAAAAEAQAGRGFLSVRRCVESINESTIGGDNVTRCIRSEVVTPGAVVGELAAKAVGSDIDFIVNSNDLAAYVAAISNAVLNRMFAEGIGLLHMAFSNGSSGNGIVRGAGGTGGNGIAQQKCASLLGTPGYSQCISSIQSGQDIREFQKNYLIQIIDQDLSFQNQLLGAKQTTLIILNESLDILHQLEECQKSPSPDTEKVQTDITTITGQIANIQSDIIALQLKEQQIKTAKLDEVPPLYAQVSNVVNPAATQSLALAAQNETSQKQMASVSYQHPLGICSQKKQLQQLQQF